MKLEKIMSKSLIVNVFLIAIKLLFGVIFSSFSLIADGIHSVSDLMSDVFVILGIKHANKPADEDHPFGHGKFEYVLSLFLSISISIMGFNLLKTVISQFKNVLSVPSPLALIIIVLVIIIKTFLARYLLRKGKELDSQIITASGKESFTDVFSSLVVLFGVGSVLIGSYFEIDFLLYGDKIASVFIAIFIFKIAIEIGLEAIISVQGKRVRNDVQEKYLKIAKEVKGVIDVDNLDMIVYGPYYQAIIDIQVDALITVKEGHDIAQRVQDKIKEDGLVCHVTIHVNPEGEQ